MVIKNTHRLGCVASSGGLTGIQGLDISRFVWLTADVMEVIYHSVPPYKTLFLGLRFHLGSVMVQTTTDEIQGKNTEHLSYFYISYIIKLKDFGYHQKM